MPPPIAFSSPWLQQLSLPYNLLPKQWAGGTPGKAAPLPWVGTGCRAKLPLPPDPGAHGWDRTAQGRRTGSGGGNAGAKTIARPEIGLGAADAQPRAATFKPVAFHEFLRGLFFLSPT